VTRGAIVVVPARNEEALIGACLEALAAQDIPGGLAVILVLDACVDGTEAAARSAAARNGRLELTLRQGPGRGVGAARRLGMDEACQRLLRRGHERGLIATTDADSAVAPDWLRGQLAAVRSGAEAIGGAIELRPVDAAALPRRALELRRARHRARLALVHRDDPAAEHCQFSGASLSVTARAYARVGGMEPLPALEDEAFAARLRRHGIPIVRTRAVRVATSGRLEGRTPAGLAHDLATSAAILPAPDGDAGIRVGA